MYQSDITSIAFWSQNNKMILNKSKTKTMVITGKRLQKKFEIKRELDGGRSFTVSAIRLWNSLQKAICEVKTENLFKKSLLFFKIQL